LDRDRLPCVKETCDPAIRMNGLQPGPANAPGWTFYVSMVAAG
jgi:hypothetical protein